MTVAEAPRIRAKSRHIKHPTIREEKQSTERSPTHARGTNVPRRRNIETTDFPLTQQQIFLNEIKDRYSGQRNQKSFLDSFDNVNQLLRVIRDDDSDEISDEAVAQFRKFMADDQRRREELGESEWVVELATGKVMRKERNNEGNELMKDSLFYISRDYPLATNKIMDMDEDAGRDGAALALTLRVIEDERQQALMGPSAQLLELDTPFILSKSA